LPALPLQAARLSEDLERGLIAVLERQCEQEAGWSWEVPNGPVHGNLGGVIANALLDLYLRNRNPATWMTLVQYADRLRNQAQAPLDDAALPLPFKADIEFLARAGRAGVIEDGRALSRKLFARLTARSATGRDEYQRIRHGRAAIPEITGYDVALAIRAAAAVGETDYAEQMAALAVADQHHIVRNGDDSFQALSAGAMLHALALLDLRKFDGAMQESAKSLLAHQSANGAWAVNNTQATAYALLGLAASGLPDTTESLVKGETWLRKTQLRSGSWAAFHDGWSEPFVGPTLPLVVAETLAALVTLQ